MDAREYSASEVRKLLQFLFPQRRLVLSQFTFFNHIGVSKPSGDTYRRGRRCYRLQDLLSIASVLALKEEGIPFKNVEVLPELIHENLNRIFLFSEECFLSGYDEKVTMSFGSEARGGETLESFFNSNEKLGLFWGFDITLMARQLIEAAERFDSGEDEKAAQVAQAA